MGLGRQNTLRHWLHVRNLRDKISYDLLFFIGNVKIIDA